MAAISKGIGRWIRLNGRLVMALTVVDRGLFVMARFSREVSWIFYYLESRGLKERDSSCRCKIFRYLSL